MGYELKQTGSGVQIWDDVSGAQGGLVMALAGKVTVAPTNTVVVGTLPANAQILNIYITVPVVSNAGTTATVSLGLSGGSGTAFTAAQDVKSAVGNFAPTATAAWAISTAKQDITVTYTETGTASTAGTVYYAIKYVVN